MSSKKHLLIIGGPTASGKTSLAIELAQHFNAPILSADSRQFYREMSIGTAKPTAEELSQAKHLFVNNLSIEDTFTVADYEQEALEALREIFSQQDVAILAGGSGLFIKAVCEGMDAFPDISESARTAVENIFAEKGLEGLQEALKEVDPDYFLTVDLHNSRRLLRALMVCESSGKPYSSFLNQSKTQRSFTPHYFCLNMDRKVLYERINKRVDQMMEEGLLAEAKELIPFKDHRALQTVGYAELFDYLEGTHDLETAIELIKRNSRRYAKRQLTWFRRQVHWQWFDPSNKKAILERAIALVKE